MNFLKKYHLDLYHNWLYFLRSLQGDVIEAWVRSPYEITQVQALYVNPIFDWATPLLGRRLPYQHHMSPDPRVSKSETLPNTVCKVQPGHITTFDGVTFTKKPTTCWTVAAQVFHEDDSFAIFTRQSKYSNDSQMEIKILVPGVAKVELLDGMALKVCLNFHRLLNR